MQSRREARRRPRSRRARRPIRPIPPLHRHDLRHGRRTDTPVAFCNVARPSLLGRLRLGHLRQAGRGQQRRADPGRDLCPRPGARGSELRQGDVRRVDDDAAGGDRSGVVSPRRRTRASSTSRPTQIITCYNSAAGAYPSATPVPTCTPGIDGSTSITTLCTFPDPLPTTTGPIASAPCTVGPPTYDANQVKTTCTVSDVTGLRADGRVPGEHSPDRNGRRDHLHDDDDARPRHRRPARSACRPTPPFDTTTACYPVVTSAMADYGAACVAGPTGVPGESVRCNLRSIDVLVADAGCADSDVGGLKTTCTTSFGTGHKYTVTQTKTVTTTPFSGAVPSGPDAVATTVTGPTNVDNVCYPAPQTFTAQPPVDIAGCSAWPCTEVTVLPGGSENSLADVAQYYYKTDLRPLMTNDPTKGGVPPAGAGPEDDKASHQHMTTFSIALGVSGTLNYQPDYRDPATVTGDFADDPHRREELAALAGPDARLLQPGQLQQSQVHRRLLARRGRRARPVLQRPESFVGHPGRRRGPREDRRQAGDGNGGRNVDPAACRGQQLHLLDELLLGLVARRRRGAADQLGTGAPGADVWSARGLLDARTFAACDDRKILLFRGGTTLVPFTWETQMCPGGMPAGASGDEPQRDRAGPCRRGQRDGVDALRHDDRWLARHRAAAAGSEEGRQARQLPARPARQRGLHVQLADQAVPQARSRPRRHRRFAAGLRRPAVRQLPGEQLHRLQDDAADADAVRRCQRRHAARVLCDRRTARRQSRPGSLGGDPERRPAQPLQAGRRQLQARRPPVLRRRHARRRRRVERQRVADDRRRRTERRRQGLLRARRDEPGRRRRPRCGSSSRCRARAPRRRLRPCRRASTPTATWASRSASRSSPSWPATGSSSSPRATTTPTASPAMARAMSMCWTPSPAS